MSSFVSFRSRASCRLPVVLFLSVLAAASAAHATPLEFDTSFAGTGELVVPGSYVNNFALQGDGKIVFVSGGPTPLMRLNPDGTYDSSFGTGGKVAFSATNEFLNAVAIQSNGKIVVAASLGTASPHAFEVTRVNADGTFDTSFGTGGKTTFSFGGDDVAGSLAIQGDGKIVVVGYDIATSLAFAAARLNPDGSLDTSFNGTGKFVYTNGGYANSVALQSDGKIVMGGSETAGGPQSMCALRLLTNGTLDSTFGTGGSARAFFGGSFRSSARQVAIASDGKIVLGGTTSDSSGEYMGVSRLNADGSLDTSLNGTGTLIPEPGITKGLAWAFGMSLMPDNKIVLAGNAEPVFARRVVAVARLNTNGSFDTTFNDTGVFFFPHYGSNGGAPVASTVKTPDANTVVLAGYDYNTAGVNNSSSAFVARLKMDLSAPQVTVTTPPANSHLLTSAFISGGVAGTATDDVGIANVKVKFFRDRATREYWNGSAFTSTSVTLTAALDHTGSVSTGWHLTSVPTAGDLDLGEYVVQATAYDTKAKASAVVTSKFFLADDATPPTLTVQHPAQNQVLLPAAFVAGGVDGTAADNQSVASVTVKLYRTNGGVKEYWNGAAFGTASVSAPVSANGLGTASVTWSLDPLPAAGDLVSGPYGVQAVAKDAAGNSVTVTRSFSIVTDATPPVAAFVSPNTNGHVYISAFDANTVRGTATDNLAVASVSLKLFRTRNGVKEFWNGTSFVTTSVAAPVKVIGLGTASVTWNLSPAPDVSSLDAGSYSAQISPRDTAGNTGVIVTRNFTVDPTAAGALANGSAESF